MRSRNGPLGVSRREALVAIAATGAAVAAAGAAPAAFAGTKAPESSAGASKDPRFTTLGQGRIQSVNSNGTVGVRIVRGGRSGLPDGHAVTATFKARVAPEPGMPVAVHRVGATFAAQPVFSVDSGTVETFDGATLALAGGRSFAVSPKASWLRGDGKLVGRRVRITYATVAGRERGIVSLVRVL
jgi:hypothetical protein